ncbi:MAG: PLDc N-terminal domain-containing protein [Alistipes sp.]|nr:PLDc N-terminal domain-containing protein [Alistipes sp.]
MGTLLYLLGTVLGIYAVYEIFTKKPGTELLPKLLWSVVVLCTSWIGIALYYFYLRDKLK